MSREIKRILISTIPRSSTNFLFDFISDLFGFSKLYPKFTGGLRATPPDWDPYLFDETYKELKNGQVLCAHYRLNADIRVMLDDSDILPIYLYRDLRDVAVSSALFIKYALPDHVFHKTFKLMSDADAISFMIAGGVICEDNFPDDMVSSPNDYMNFDGLSHFIDDSLVWLSDPRVVKIRFEEFVLDPFIFVEAAKKVGVIINPDDVKEVSKKWNFKVAANGRENGIEDKSSHYRKGVAGDYINYFSEIHYTLTQKHLSKWLIPMGY